MPKATVNASDTERFELKSLPEGYVVLRRLTYDQYLERRDIAMKLEMEGGAESRSDVKMNLASTQAVVAAFEFQHSIVEHNLEDENGNLLQFPHDLRKLDPRIGEEIAGLIEKMNTFEAEVKN